MRSFYFYFIFVITIIFFCNTPSRLEGKALENVIGYANSGESLAFVSALNRIFSSLCAVHLAVFRRNILLTAALSGISDACEGALGTYITSFVIIFTIQS